jgi:mannose-1-phosphate guanylyltransferase
MTTKLKFKGVILAAGLGTRLQPLTKFWPKPLVPFLGTTALELALWRFKCARIDNIAINAHHLPEQIKQAASQNLLKQEIHISHEPTLLGTGGVYAPLKAWREGQGLVVLNGDIISDIDLTQLIDQHVSTKSLATMAVLPDVIPGESAVWHKNGLIHAIGKVPIDGQSSGNFACAQVLSAEFLDLLPEQGLFDIISKGYRMALDKAMTVSCLVHQGIWHDLRTPQFYWEAIKDCLLRIAAIQNDSVGVMSMRKLRQMTSVVGSQYVLSDLPDSMNQKDLHLGPWAVIEKDTQLGHNCHISESVILPGTTLAPGTRVDRRIVGREIDISIL